MKDSCKMIVCQISNRIFMKDHGVAANYYAGSQRDNGTSSLHYKTSVLQKEALLLQRKQSGNVLPCVSTGTTANLQLRLLLWSNLRTQNHLSAPRLRTF